MEKIENLFKHKYPLNLFSTWESNHIIFYVKGFRYKTEKIKEGSTVGILYIDDLIERIKSFVAYFISKSNIEHLPPENKCSNTVFNINIKSFDKKHEQGFSYIKMIRLEMGCTEKDFNFSNVKFTKHDCNEPYLQKPFEIHIETERYIQQMYFEEESEYENEYEIEYVSEEESEEESEKESEDEIEDESEEESEDENKETTKLKIPQKIENLFKHKYPLNFFSSSTYITDQSERYEYHNKTPKIKDGSSINIHCINNLTERTKPLIEYFISKSNMEPLLPGYQSSGTTFNINIKSFDSKYEPGFSYIDVLNFDTVL